MKKGHVISQAKGLIKRGVTLIEMTVTMVLVMLIASTSLVMLNQQTDFYVWLNSQKFLVDDAPATNSLVVRILSQADAFKVHTSQSDALASTGGVTSGGSILVLGFAQPDGSREYGMLEFSKGSGAATGSLTYSVLSQSGSSVNSSWTVANGIADATFEIENGILLFKMTGPFGAKIQHAASSSL